MEVVNWILLGIFALILLMLLTVGGIAVYSGLFTSFTVGAGPPPVKSLVLVYKFGRGPYSRCVDVFNEACSIAPDKRSIGFYYDDPKQVPAESLRWAVGSIVAEGADFPDTEVLGKFMDEGYKVFHTPQISNAVRTQFPYTTPFSIFIAIFRVYPVLGDYVKSKQLCAHPYLEIYDGNIMHFMAPLAQQDDFYVPEVLEDEQQEETPERESSVEPPETPERGQGDAKIHQLREKALPEEDLVKMAANTQNEIPTKKDDKDPEKTPTEESVPVVPSDDLKLPDSEKDHDGRSVSTSSFLTAKSEVTKNDADEKKAVDEAVERIKVKLNKSTPEGVQDAGISSTSRGSNTPTPVTRLDATDSTDPGSSQQDSSSNIGSSATSLDSVSSMTSSVTSHSETSYTSHSFTSGSSYNEDSAADLSRDQSTEVSCDLNEVSGDSDADVENSQARVKAE